jgi:hypothetical protein
MRAARGAACLLPTASAVSTLLAAPAPAAPSTKLQVSLTPERLGAGTTIAFAFEITSPGGAVPPPLTSIDLRYPANLGLITSGLGPLLLPRGTRSPERLPPDSLMGYGSALAEIEIGPEPIFENVQITAWMAPIEHGHLGTFAFLDGSHASATACVPCPAHRRRD